jgi:hypothetical protein
MLKEISLGTSSDAHSNILSPLQGKCLCCYVKSSLILSHLCKNSNGLATCLSNINLDVPIVDFLMRRRTGGTVLIGNPQACEYA